MILKESFLVPADRCGVHFVKVFHLYRGWNRKCSFIGDFLKVSVRKTSPSNWLKKKTKLRAFLLRTKFKTVNNDGSSFFFRENNAVLLKKRLTTKGKEIWGPSIKKLKRRKFLAALPGYL